MTVETVNVSNTGRLAQQCASQAVGVSACGGKVVENVNGKTDKHSDTHWFIAIVANNTERACAQKLSKINIESYVIAQKYISKWKDGRRKVCERVFTPGKILVRCTESERLNIVGLPFISRFMVNISGKANEFGKRPIAIVPDRQVDKCRFLLGQTDVDVSFDNRNITKGEKVSVIRGALLGLEGEVVGTSSDKSRIYVNLDFLGCASVLIDTADVERVR